MTVAVCFNCGNFKHGALSACEKCGATPKSDEDYTVSMQMTDHFYDQAQLEDMSARIRSGTHMRASEDEIKMWTEQRLKLRQGPLGDIVNKLDPTERSIPAPMPERRALVCELLYKQINEFCKESTFPQFDPTTPDDTPDEALFSLPQGLILLIVEQYLAAKRQNIRNYRIFEFIHKNLSPLLKEGVLLKKGDRSSIAPPLNPRLEDYVRYFISSTAYAAMDGLTDQYIDYSINRIVAFYSEPTKQNRSGSQNAGGATKTEKYTDEHRRLIAQRLIEYERQMPGSMRMKTNRLLIKYTLSALESVGIKKPLLKGVDQHIYDTMVSNETALETLLRASLLIGNNHKGKHPCWSGRGKYIGWLGMLQLDDFTTENMEKCVLVILMTAIEPLMEPYLEQLPSGWDKG